MKSHISHWHDLSFFVKSEEKLKKIAVLTRPGEEEIEDPVCKGCPQIIHGSACTCQSGSIFGYIYHALNRPLSWCFLFTCSITHSALILKTVTSISFALNVEI
jgi:hypothetical protein